MIIKGFRFGLLLQVAIGPVCFYVIKTATDSGMIPAIAAVIAATIVDALFVSFAILGIGSLLEKPKVKGILKYSGSFILVYFGFGIILESFKINIIPGLGEMSSLSTSSAFITGFILTASSPLTILFWAGVFATKMSCENYDKTDMKLFGVGAVSTTLVFLGVVAFTASLFQTLMTSKVIFVLNIVVGVILLAFAVKMFFRKVTPSVASSE